MTKTRLRALIKRRQEWGITPRDLSAYLQLSPVTVWRWEETYRPADIPDFKWNAYEQAINTLIVRRRLAGVEPKLNAS